MTLRGVWTDVVGQVAAVEALAAAVRGEPGAMSHAWLITGPPGSTITSTTPQADNVDGLTVTYNDVGPIGPGQSVRLTIGVRVPDNAPAGSTYAEQLRVTADCDGQPVQGGLDFTGPRVGERPAPAGPAGPGQLPRTGGAFPLAGLAFMAFGAGLLRLRG